MFLGKTLYSHSASIHPGVQMGTGELSRKSDKMVDVTVPTPMNLHPIQGYSVSGKQ